MRRCHRNRLGSLLLGSLLAASFGCGRGSDSEGASLLPAGTPIVLISIDTLRADRLPAYGYDAGETPAIDRLAGDGLLFENAYSHVPLTLPAHASLFSGRLPPDHKVRDNVGYLFDGQQQPSLAARLQQRGYATAGAVSAYVLRAATGIAAGFQLYQDSIENRVGSGLGGLQRPGRETLRQLLPWLEGVAEEPFFLFLHLYEPHSPYDPPAAFAARFASPYDGEIAAADAIVGELLDRLDSLDLYDRALILLVSDHGEGLGDHGEQEHGVLLHREALHIPFILKLPRQQRAGDRISTLVGLIDIYPTLVEALGDPASPALPGRSLLMLEGDEERSMYAETFYPRLHFGWSDLASLTTSRWHYIEGPRPELYDLQADPGETRNVLADHRRIYRELRERLNEIDRALSPPSQVDEETLRKLAALGYVGSADVLDDGPFDDPKDHLELLDELRQATRHFAARDYERAVPAFRAVLAKNPRMVDAWESLAHSYERLGRREEALAAYRQAIQQVSGAPHLLIPAGFLLMDLGRLEEASSHAELALATSPAEARDLLARIALRRGDLAVAEQEARRAVAEDGARVAPLLTLGQILVERGTLDEALAVALRAKDLVTDIDREDPERIRGLYFLLGTVQARLGDGAAAEIAFLEQLRLFPDSLGAYAELALLYALIGRGEEAAAKIRQMVEVNDTPAAYGRAVQTLRLLGDPESAQSLLRFAARKFPDSEELRTLLIRKDPIDPL